MLLKTQEHQSTVPLAGPVRIAQLFPRDFPFERVELWRDGVLVKQTDYAGPGNAVEVREKPGGIGFSIGLTIVLALVNVGIGLLTRQRAGLGPDDDAERVGFTGIPRVSSAGENVPWVFGKVRVQPITVQSAFEPRFAASVDDGRVAIAPDDDDAPDLAVRTFVALGPIKGTGRIWLDDDLIEDYEGATSDTTLGNLSQLPPDGWDEQRLVQDLGNDLVAGSRVSKETVGAPDRTLFEIRFTQGLFAINGDRLAPAQVDFALTQDGAQVAAFTISRQVRGPVSVWVRGPASVGQRVTYGLERLTPDQDPDDLDAPTDACRFESMVELNAGQRNYPGIAQLSVRAIPQSQTRAFSQVSVETEGYARCAIVKNGIVSYGYSTNPAYIALTVITDEIWGHGARHKLEDCDLESFERAAKSCERRHLEFNYAFESDLDLPPMLATIMQSAALDIDSQGGRWRIFAIEESAPVMQFREDLYLRESLVYSRDAEPAPTLISARIADAELDYVASPVSRAWDAVGQQRAKNETLNLAGVTSRRQAEVLLQLELQRSHLERSSIRFQTTAARAMRLNTGDVFEFASVSAGIGLGSGQIRRVLRGGRRLEIDRDIESTDELEIIVEAGENQHVCRVLSVEDNYVNLEPRDWKVRPGDGYTIGVLQKSIDLFRCTEKSTTPEGLVEITARSYVARANEVSGTFGYSDAQPQPVLDRMPGLVTGVTAQRLASREVDLDWIGPADIVAYYQIWSRVGGSSWRPEGDSRTLSFRTRALSDGFYDFKIIAVSPGGRQRSVGSGGGTSLLIG